jgi:hypothetical protein
MTTKNRRSEMRSVFMMAGLLILSATLRAEQVTYGTASTGAAWVKLPVSARMAGLGEAGSALSGTADSLAINPAGLTGMNGMQAGFMHYAWVQGMSVEHLSFGMPRVFKGVKLGLATSLDYLNFGSIDKYNVVNNKPVANGTANPTALQFGMGAAGAVGPVTSGLGLKILSQNLDGSSATALAVDLGVHYNLGDVTTAAVLQNLGSQIDGADLPRTLKLGAGYLFRLGSVGRFTLLGDADLPFAEFRSTAVSLGGEYWYFDTLAVRVGSKIQDRGGLSGFSGLNCGLGYRYKMVQVDYALTTQGDLGLGNMFSIVAWF